MNEMPFTTEDLGYSRIVSDRFRRWIQRARSMSAFNSEADSTVLSGLECLCQVEHLHPEQSLEIPATPKDDLELSNLPTFPLIPARDSIRITSQRERSSLHFTSEDAGVDRGVVVHEDSILGFGFEEISKRLGSVDLIHWQTISTARELK
ncbi:hypothetical protein CDAR_385471 [Caerostris darwini]|uniref:Uncharacterized protein n=1 Tax=Caerostris darwini TaxID=1538125 RepID=A0AAV4W8R9_9ARAC|nr:hypothetical protein CDAR_385471 [Caerostris darwini]